MSLSLRQMNLGVCSLALAFALCQVSQLAAQPPCAAPPCGAPACAPGCGVTSTTSCNFLHCPPALKHTTVGPPCIKFCTGCPKPACGPCEMQNFGYYEPCWRPFSGQRDLTHCPPPANGAGLVASTIAITPSTTLPGHPSGAEPARQLPLAPTSFHR